MRYVALSGCVMSVACGAALFFLSVKLHDPTLGLAAFVGMLIFGGSFAALGAWTDVLDEQLARAKRAAEKAKPDATRPSATGAATFTGNWECD